MDNFSLTPDGVCAIIRECAASGVRELTFGPLHVHFGGIRQVNDEFVADTEVSPERLEKQDAIASRELERDELAHKDDQLAHALVENPVEFEDLLIQGELVEISSTVGDELEDGENDSGPEPSLQRS